MHKIVYAFMYEDVHPFYSSFSHTSNTSPQQHRIGTPTATVTAAKMCLHV